MGLKRDYYKKCMTCIKYNIGRQKRNTLYCTGYNEYYAPDDSCNSKYSENNSMSDELIKDTLKRLGYRFYITTSIMNILISNATSKEEIDFYTNVLNVLNDYKDNVLDKDEKYAEWNKIYNKNAVVLAEKLNNDPNSLEIATAIYYECLLPVYNCIINGNFDLAFELYDYMFTLLQEKYSVNAQRKRTTN